MLEAFADLRGRRRAAGMLDLPPVVAGAARAPAGSTRIDHVDRCTSCRADLFFSHRRDDGVTGRQAGLAWRA